MNLKSLSIIALVLIFTSATLIGSDGDTQPSDHDGCPLRRADTMILYTGANNVQYTSEAQAAAVKSAPAATQGEPSAVAGQDEKKSTPHEKK